jgi:hypothetical protein
MLGDGLFSHCGDLGLDLRAKDIGDGLSPGQQVEGCRAGLLGGEALVI